MSEYSLPLTRRLRRNRKSSAVREMLAETKLSVSDFVYPVFIMDGENQEETIPSMPGITRKTIDVLLKELEEVTALGILAIAPFPAISDDLKDEKASASYAPDGLVQRAIRKIKERFPNLVIMTDVALDPFSSSGHDGILSESGEILNDETAIKDDDFFTFAHDILFLLFSDLVACL